MFKKVGDAVPILSSFDNKGKKQLCPKCNKPLTTIIIDQDHNELVCPVCDLDDLCKAGEGVTNDNN